MSKFPRLELTVGVINSLKPIWLFKLRAIPFHGSDQEDGKSFHQTEALVPLNLEVIKKRREIGKPNGFNNGWSIN